MNVFEFLIYMLGLSITITIGSIHFLYCKKVKGE